MRRDEPMRRDDPMRRDPAPGVTEDGCSVDVYARLPEVGEAAMVEAVAPPGSSVLDLGAGTGRIADPLADAGYDVVAVDSSAQMLDRVRRAATVLGHIETLRLERRFDVVLLASHLVNTPDASGRAALLAAVARHLNPAGVALLEWHPPEWFEGLLAGRTYRGEIGPFATELRVTSLVGGRLSATVSYTARGERWEQAFTCRRLTASDMRTACADAGLTAPTPVLGSAHWLRTTRIGPPEPGALNLPQEPSSRTGRTHS